jgi:glutamine amidotransferase
MLAILDYDAGNLASVERAVRRLGASCVVTRDAEEIRRASRIVFPGVGAAGSAMESVRRYGLDKALKEALAAGKPVLGICLGTQIIMGHSEENNTVCLGLVPGNVARFPEELRDVAGARLKVPQMGWNSVRLTERGKTHPVFAGLLPEHQFYFVHSYQPRPENPEHVLGETDYGIVFPSVIGRANLVAVQFHPEKSGEPGLALLGNFLRWTP